MPPPTQEAPKARPGLPMLGRAPAAESPSPPLWAIGFRPFFLLAALYAVLIVPLWVFWVLPGHSLTYPMTPVSWHVHEMLFGYTAAVVAGFLLTAVQNWTGKVTTRGPGLQLLAGLWLLGRLACLFGGALPWLAAAVDLSFLPAVAFFIARPIIAARSHRNLVFIATLLFLTAVNAMFHFGETPAVGAGPGPIQAAFDLIALMVIVMGGRVIPPFTRNVVGRDPRPNGLLDRAGFALMLVVVLLDLIPAPISVLGGALIAAGTLNSLRLWGWNGSRTLRTPILWVLHLAWLCIGASFIGRGLLLLGVATFGPLGASLSTHLLTVGGIGLITLGMMARVSLGHTGRPLQLAPAARWAIYLLALSALARVVLPLAMPSLYLEALYASSVLWSLAFVLFLWAYWSVLTRPRADGKPG